MQLAEETTVPVPTNYEHDDKENRVEEPAASEEISTNIMDQYLHPAMFDGTSDLLGISGRHSCHPRIPSQVDESDYDSVLGSDTD